MPSTAFLILSVGLLAGYVNGKHAKMVFEDKQNSPNLADDIVLTPEQEQQLKERGFYVAGKWPKKRGLVTIPYFFDPVTIPKGHPIRDTFDEAVEIYTKHTCIDWEEVHPYYGLHKVRIYRGQGCHSQMGMTGGSQQDISLGEGCDNIETMIHEMGHCVGLFHTQSRPDRDEYVKPWLRYVQKGKEINFDKSTGETFGIPYDYKSMMHYANDDFSVNGSFTLTTSNPFALFAIGARPSTFRFSDAALINYGYRCIDDFVAKCGQKNCENKGYVDKSCKCRCPENTSGERCEVVNGPFFSDKPDCGGEVTTEGVVMSKNYPQASSKGTCIYSITAPECKLPEITLKVVNFVWWQCDGNKLALQVSKESFGYTWCSDEHVMLNTPIVSDSRKAAIYYYNIVEGRPYVGFKAAIRFVHDPKCGPAPSTTLTVPPTISISTVPPTISGSTVAPPISGSTVAPSSSCEYSETGLNSFNYQTSNFPSLVKQGVTCSMTKEGSLLDMVFTKMVIDLRTTSDDILTIRDSMLESKLSGKKEITHYVLGPYSISFNNPTTLSNGFKLVAVPVTGLPHPCNGQTLYLNPGETITVSNPLFGMTSKYVHCAFHVQAPEDMAIAIKPVVNEVTRATGEKLAYTLDLPYDEDLADVTQSELATISNNLVLYYAGGEAYSKWTLSFKIYSNQ